MSKSKPRRGIGRGAKVPEGYVSVAEAARRLGIDPSRVRARCVSGELEGAILVEWLTRTAWAIPKVSLPQAPEGKEPPPGWVSLTRLAEALNIPRGRMRYLMTVALPAEPERFPAVMLADQFIDPATSRREWFVELVPGSSWARAVDGERVKPDPIPRATRRRRGEEDHVWVSFRALQGALQMSRARVYWRLCKDRPYNPGRYPDVLDVQQRKLSGMKRAVWCARLLPGGEMERAVAEWEARGAA